MPITYLLLAAACPPIPTPGGYPASAFTLAGVSTASTAPNAEPVTFGTVGSAGAFATPSILNRNAARLDLLGRYGAGCWAVADGLALSAGTGLTVSVAAGHAVIDGAVEMPLAQTIAVPNNAASIFIWLLRGAAGSYPTLYAAPALTLPPSPGVLLGSVTTAAGAVTATDGSGVLRLIGGKAYRQTADTLTPGDTPPPDAAFNALTLGGEFRWNGTAYTGGAKAQVLLTLAPQSFTLTPGANYLVGVSFSPSFPGARYRVGCVCSDPLVVISEALGQKTSTKMFFSLHYILVSGGSTTPVAVTVTATADGLGYIGPQVTGVAGTWDALTAF